MGLCMCFLDSKLLRMLNYKKELEETVKSAYDRPLDCFVLGLKPQNQRHDDLIHIPDFILLNLEINKHGAFDVLPSFLPYILKMPK